MLIYMHMVCNIFSEVITMHINLLLRLLLSGV